MAVTDADAIDFKISPDDQDEHGFVSIWNIASTTCEADVPEARALAAKLLNFLCKKNVISLSAAQRMLSFWTKNSSPKTSYCTTGSPRASTWRFSRSTPKCLRKHSCRF